MLTLVQLYELGKSRDIDIYDGIKLPSGSPLDKSVMVNSIIMRCGLNYPMYADPEVMRTAIALWSAKNQYTFEHIAKIYEASYSPIENYDRFEDTKIDRSHNLTDKTTGENSKNETIETGTTINGNFTDTVNHSGTDTTTTETTVSAYNASTYQPDTKTTNGLQHGEKIVDQNYSTSSTTGGSTKDISGDSEVNKAVNESEITKNTGRIHGNIGVMTATTMQTEEYNLLEKFNPYDFIAGIFENELTLFIY